MAENKYLQWLSGNTKSVYWHDSAIVSELEDAIGNGACGMTTNPFLIGATLTKTPSYWKEVLPAMPSGLSDDERAEEYIAQCTAHLAKRLSAFYDGSGNGRGYCCAQTNPARVFDVEGMVNSAKHYAAGGENIVVKMPATRSGIEAIEECAALGINVAATVSFTVPQVLAVGEAVKRGQERAVKNGVKPGLGIAVLMVGRLDDYLRDVMLDTRAKATEADIIWSGTAAIKRAYEIFKERNYSCVLMPAGCRGGYHITELAGAEMIMSIAPAIAKSLEGVTAFEERIDRPVDPAIIDRLMTMPEFVKAYEPDGMTADEFITFGSCNRTLDQFVQCGWNVLKSVSL